MRDLNKVNSSRLFSYWKNLSVGMAVLIVMLILSRVLPAYFSPIISLFAAAFLYTLLYNNKILKNQTCMIVPYAMFYCTISYSFITIILNILDIWNFVHIPKELSFFNEPFIAALILDPVCFITFFILYLRRNRLAICIDCKISKGLSIERGKLGEILNVETHKMLVNLIMLFLILSLVVWVYFFFWYYRGALLNNRDWYIFLWVNVIGIVLDELYFVSRSVNIYLDLKENGEIITEAELSDMTTKTYLRFYVVCGNKVFLNDRVADPVRPNHYVIDTPFVTKRNVNGITTGEVQGIIRRLSGINDGELRFFYGRKSPDMAKHRILRYFYFLKNNPEECPEIDLDGKWVDFENIKGIYNDHPTAMSAILLTDISRMVTVILTQKIFDERGYRKIKVKSYHPTFNLEDVRDSDYDFQDDKWLRIAMYNSDTRGFHFRQWWDKLMGIRKNRKNKGEWQRRQ